jgi:integrase
LGVSREHWQFTFHWEATGFCRASVKTATSHYSPWILAHQKQLEKAGRMTWTVSDEDFEKLHTRLDEPNVFWLKAFLTMTFKYGFRKGELLRATCGYFDPKAATFTLPPFVTKNKQARVVDLNPDGEIFQMLPTLTEGRAADAPLFTRNGKAVRDFRGEWARQTCFGARRGNRTPMARRPGDFESLLYICK